MEVMSDASLFLAQEQETATGRRTYSAAGSAARGQDPCVPRHQACLLQGNTGGKGKGNGKGLESSAFLWDSHHSKKSLWPPALQWAL